MNEDFFGGVVSYMTDEEAQHYYNKLWYRVYSIWWVHKQMHEFMTQYLYGGGRPEPPADEPVYVKTALTAARPDSAESR